MLGHNSTAYWKKSDAAHQLVRSKTTREVRTAEDNASIICRDFAAENGLIVRAVGQSMVLSPPLTISHAEVDEMIEKLSRALNHAAKIMVKAA
jgi:putrescine aminotransferase